MQEKEEGRRGTFESWKCLWQIRAPPKAKHILWWICRECLPATIQLRQHHVPCPAICELWRGANEDMLHMLFECTPSKNCWSMAGLNSAVAAQLEQFNNAKDVIFDICSKDTKEVVGMMPMMIWLMWNNVNQSLWNHAKSEERCNTIGYTSLPYMG
jgi:hypothetical protein